MGVFSSAQARSEEFCTKGIFFNITPLRFHHCFMAPEAHQGITGRNGRVGVAIANTYLNTIILESNTKTLKA
jgi:hypothetical protein